MDMSTNPRDYPGNRVFDFGDFFPGDGAFNLGDFDGAYKLGGFSWNDQGDRADSRPEGVCGIGTLYA